MRDIIEYYRAGAECHPICKDRGRGCPCTETADAIERLQAEIKALKEKLADRSWSEFMEIYDTEQETDDE